MKWLMSIGTILVLLLGIELRISENLETLDLNNLYTHFSAFTLHPRIHRAMVQMVDWDPSRTYRIAEFGAGNGLSTSIFQEYLREHQIPHTYTLCEYDETYGPELAQYPGELHLSKWEDLAGSEPYDVILMTVFSSVNVKNTEQLQKLLAPGGQLVILYMHLAQPMIWYYGYEIQAQKLMSMRYSVYRLGVASP